MAASTLQGEQFIENEFIKVGVDLDSGGGIFYFSNKDSERNLLNHKDKGRLIQQSYYGAKDGSTWDKKPWRWNPVQGGDYKNGASEILEIRNTGTSLYVKTRPRHWAAQTSIDDVIMEETITLEGSVAKIHFKCTYTGATVHPVTHQETPAVFIDAALPVLHVYEGNAPWTNAPLKTVTPGFPNKSFNIDENWAAYTDESGFGLGVFVPGVDRITAYRYEGAGTVGPKGDSCSYFAPIRSFAFDKPMTFEYNAFLTAGNIIDIRSRFQKIATSLSGDPAPVGTRP